MSSSQSYNLNTLITTYNGQDPQGELTEQNLATSLASSAQAKLINVKLPFGTNLTPAKGDGSTDDTVAINAMVQYVKSNNLDGLYFPSSAGYYMIQGQDNNDTVYYSANGGIVITSPMRIVLHPNAVLKAITGNQVGYRVLNIKDTSNVYIEGGSIIGERDTHIGTTGQFGHGIYVSRCTNVHISKITITNCWGDSLCIGGLDGDTSGYSQDIFLHQVIARNSRRQGLSLVSAKRVYINNCEFSQINGSDPQSGIDIESNTNYPINEDIFISKCKFNQNTNNDIVIANNVNNVIIDGCISTGAINASISVGNNITVNGLQIINNIIDMTNSTTGANGIGLGSGNDVIIKGNIIKNIPSTSGNGINIQGALDGIKISENTIAFCAYGIGIYGTATNMSILNNRIHDTTNHAIYPYVRITDSEIIGNSIYNFSAHGIFARLTRCTVNQNKFRNGQWSGLSGDSLLNCIISENSFIDLGKAAYATANASIELQGTTADNFIFGNYVRNSITGHIAVRDSGTPSTPNVVSKNNLRYNTVGSVLNLNASDISDGNLTL